MRKFTFARKSLMAALIALASVKAKAQQDVMYSQYMFNTLGVNPSYAGSRDVLSITAIGRYQWLGQNVNGAPTTYSLTADMPFKNEKMGIGLVAINDKLGLSSNTSVGLAYSYKLKVGNRSTLALGIEPSVSNYNIDFREAFRRDQDDVNFNSNVSKTLFNVGAGLFLSNDVAYIGFSVPQILEDNGVGIRRHYFTMLGVVLGKGNIKVKPSTMLRYTKGTPLGFDLNVNTWFREKFAIGISGRKSQTVFSGRDAIDAIVGMLEFQLTPQLRLGYAYDYNHTNLNVKNSIAGTPTHELLLRFEFGFNKSKVITPRYF